ncbi:hypothetical protein BASA50_009982 [Batrachochytrium salamandrivorans]|uniref:non-specific serine/threonine protein kinase n=1 Tax=Batrachochytrium salamandrivorans TaxID=1357716 RepID=A0ABQ8F0B2_9FUNG|nr:hypothetical protein BASA62_003620 [Batrachochytrium salamandrivorans]KAH6589540.1 hypothetical protein BASA50_009982 [Batrachochytrium salamandrivorans]
MASLHCSLILLLSVATIQVQAIKWDLEGIKGGYHQQQPELQRPTLHADPPSARPKLSRPTFMKKRKSQRYLWIQENDDYCQFFEEEDKYFKSEYRSVKKLGESEVDDVHLAIKKSNGLRVVYKTIERNFIVLYTLESSPPPECHSTEVSTLGGKHAGAGCVSPRPLNLVLPLEIKIHEYLTQPGYENTYVPRVVDYFVAKQSYILVMEYSGEDWIDLNWYMMKHGKVSVDKARPIIKEVVTALISLKSLGILHRDIAARNILYNDKTGGVKMIDFGLSKPLKGWNQGSSTQTEFSESASGSSGGKPDAGDEEISDMRDISDLLYFLLTLDDTPKDRALPREEVVRELKDRLDDPESQPEADAVDLVASIYNCGSTQIISIENILDHSFFTSQ